jgi:hypothetical protein
MAEALSPACHQVEQIAACSWSPADRRDPDDPSHAARRADLENLLTMIVETRAERGSRSGGAAGAKNPSGVTKYAAIVTLQPQAIRAGSQSFAIESVRMVGLWQRRAIRVSPRANRNNREGRRGTFVPAKTLPDASHMLPKRGFWVARPGDLSECGLSLWFQWWAHKGSNLGPAD